MKQYTDAFALWNDIQAGLLVANQVADVPGIYKIFEKATSETLYTFVDESEALSPWLEETVEATLQRRKWYQRYILGSTHGHQANWELKMWIARATRGCGKDDPIGLTIGQLNALLEEVDLAHANSKMIASSNRWVRDQLSQLEKDAAEFKLEVRRYIDFVSTEAPEDPYCMCGQEVGGSEHQAPDGSHSFCPAFQYSEKMARERVEAFYPKIGGGNQDLQPVVDQDTVEIPHTDLQGNVGKVIVPALAPEHYCSYSHCGPNGEIQCTYCGKPKAVVESTPTGLPPSFGGFPGQHVLYKKGDFGIPDQILDRNGDVALDCCKICGAAEQELIDVPVCPGPSKKVYRHG